ncbi:Fungalysin metallopeptidase-domain-containing protein [Zopfochytrium polystomum]|nr:Fungalysin metallopeptidase-domain-containing protein [Zopfochytrium polystomum]
MNIRALIEAAASSPSSLAAVSLSALLLLASPAAACWHDHLRPAAAAASSAKVPAPVGSPFAPAEHTTRQHSGIGFGPDLSAFAVRDQFPEAAVESASAPRLGRRDDGSAFDPVRVAVDYAVAKLNASHFKPPSRDHKIVVTDSYTSEHNGVTHVYLIQQVDGLDVANAVANVNIGRNGKVISFHSTFFTEGSPASSPAPSKDVPVFVEQSEGSRLVRRGGDLPADVQDLITDIGEVMADVGEKVDHIVKELLEEDEEDSSDSDDEKKRSGHHNRHKKDEKDRKKHKKHRDETPEERKLRKALKRAAKEAARRERSAKQAGRNGGAAASASERPHDADFISPLEALSALADHLGRAVAMETVELIPYHTFKPKTRDDPDYLIILTAASGAAPGGDRPMSLFSGAAAEAAAGGTANTIPASLKYIINSAGDLVPVWDLKLDLGDHWFHSHIDARRPAKEDSSGKVISLVDWVSDASYTVYPLGINDPESGSRSTVVDPAHTLASPLGWHSHGGKKHFTDTRGNNVYAQENLDGRNEWENNGRPDGGKSLSFDFPVDLKIEPSEYLDGAVTNLFYWNNAIHDLFYVYGFTEKAGNFQENNLDRGGKDKDAVIANAQDGSGYNNANFATPPDGFRGRMRMYVWDVTDPMRDGDLEGGIIMHEYAHGISTRLTGGPANSGCLGWGEAGGMGEGWGDFFATILRMTPNSTRSDIYGMGEYANGGDGIRKYRYSTSLEVNPSTYSYVAKPGYWGVHAKGEVWAAMLYEYYWDLVDYHGFNPDWFETGLTESSSSETYRDFRTGLLLKRDGIVKKANKDKKKKKKPVPSPPEDPAPQPEPAPEPTPYPYGGNVLALQLVVDGLKLQPCTPSFVDARDAILSADDALTGGENKCIIWKSFAKRGLGLSAASGGRDGFDVPLACADGDGDDDSEL